MFLLKTTAVTVSLIVALLVSEAVLRALGENVPPGIAAERHDLGEVNRDAHWVDSPRYGRRLRANVDTLNEWRDGDIVRMGFIPPSARANPLQRFSFQTDAEGFRNPAVRDRFEIAALGDSFTDAMTMAREASWPARLEATLGVSVQNYGTAGFGPQQELMVLKEYVAKHRPRTVVLAFFAGNDLFDAEAFDAFQRSGGTIKRPQPGWRIKDLVSRIDHLPSKSQTYLPLVDAALPRDLVRSAFDFYLKSYGRATDVDRMLANRLAQNQMMAQLCAAAGIPLLDTTLALAARAATGENVYFPDESHLNHAGEALIAEELAAFLKGRPERP